MARKDRQGFNAPFADLKRKLKAEKKAKREIPAVSEPREEAGTTGTTGKTASSLPAPTADPSESTMFEEWMSGVEPLREEGRGRVNARRPKEDLPRTTQPDEDAEVMATLFDLVAGEGDFEVFDTDEYVEGHAPGVDRRLLRRLKRGEFSTQAHLDLHGMVREQAKKAVTDFVRASRQAGRRCVIIVHGRGLRSPGGEPVLKKSLVRWLCRGNLGSQVLAFTTTLPHDGGGGAMYVLLRR